MHTQVAVNTQAKPIAFYRMEGVLSSRPTLAAAAYFAGNAQGVKARIGRLGTLAFAAPMALLKEPAAALTSSKLTWSGVRGLTEDRLHVLAEEYYERYVESSAVDAGVDLLKRSKKRGHEVVLVSDNIDLIVAPFAKKLGISEYICNKLELRDGDATGRLLEPVIGGHLTRKWAVEYASKSGRSIEGAYAYGSQATDSMLLSGIDNACAVNPDRRLRQVAKDQAWPVVEA